jgi:xanthine dehydrogenase molybdopterin-binding subunit B
MASVAPGCAPPHLDAPATPEAILLALDAMIDRGTPLAGKKS